MVRWLGKFTSDYCDLPTLLWNVAMFLRGGTININRSYNQPISWIFYLIITFAGACYFYAYIFSMVWFVLVRYPETGDFTTAIVELSLTTCSVTSIPKFFYMKLYYNTVMDLVEEYLRCDKLVVKGTRFATNFLNNLKCIKKRGIIVWTVIVMNAMIYVTIPFLLPGRHFCEDLYIIYGRVTFETALSLFTIRIITDVSYQYSHQGLEPMFESPNYEIAKVMMTAGVYFSVFMVVHITLFIIVIIGCLEAQALALSEELIHIWDDSEKFYNIVKIHNRHIQKDKVRNIFVEIRLRDIVKFHSVIINLRKTVDMELRFIFVIDFIFMILAIVTELIGGLNNTYVQIPFTVAQVFMDCFIGQRLIDASQVFENSIYSSGWENFQLSNQKTVLLILKCSQKTLTLSAGGLVVLNFPCLMFVFRSTYSAYTTLESSG